MKTAGTAHAIDDTDNTRNETHFETIRKLVVDNLAKAHDKSKRHYDLRARPCNYTVGETVWKKTFPLSDSARGFAAKLAPKYLKCVVTRKIGMSSYELSDENGKILVYSAQKISKIIMNKEKKKSITLHTFFVYFAKFQF